MPNMAIDLARPHGEVLQKMIPHGKGSVVANTLGLRNSNHSPNKYDDYAIFKTRMVHPSGTILGERMQKQISMMEL